MEDGDSDAENPPANRESGNGPFPDSAGTWNRARGPGVRRARLDRMRMSQLETARVAALVTAHSPAPLPHGAGTMRPLIRLSNGGYSLSARRHVLDSESGLRRASDMLIYY